MYLKYLRLFKLIFNIKNAHKLLMWLTNFLFVENVCKITIKKTRNPKLALLVLQSFIVKISADASG